MVIHTQVGSTDYFPSIEFVARTVALLSCGCSIKALWDVPLAVNRGRAGLAVSVRRGLGRVASRICLSSKSFSGGHTGSIQEALRQMIQRLAFSYEGIAGDIRRLGDLLEEVFALAEVRMAGKIAVLNLACGRADESGVLAAAMAPAEIGFYLGVDLRADAISEARKRWELPGGEIDFREGNAAMIGRMENLPEFDLIFIRHQNYWHEPMVWEGILDEALGALKDGGYLICTSYFDTEHELLLASLREKHANLIANVRHPFSRDLPDATGKSVDRWVAVFRKTP